MCDLTRFAFSPPTLKCALFAHQLFLSIHFFSKKYHLLDLRPTSNCEFIKLSKLHKREFQCQGESHRIEMDKTRTSFCLWNREFVIGHAHHVTSFLLLTPRRISGVYFERWLSRGLGSADELEILILLIWRFKHKSSRAELNIRPVVESVQARMFFHSFFLVTLNLNYFLVFTKHFIEQSGKKPTKLRHRTEAVKKGVKNLFTHLTTDYNVNSSWGVL